MKTVFEDIAAFFVSAAICGLALLSSRNTVHFISGGPGFGSRPATTNESIDSRNQIWVTIVLTFVAALFFLLRGKIRFRRNLKQRK